MAPEASHCAGAIPPQRCLDLPRQLRRQRQRRQRRHGLRHARRRAGAVQGDTLRGFRAGRCINWGGRNKNVVKVMGDDVFLDLIWFFWNLLDLWLNTCLLVGTTNFPAKWKRHCLILDQPNPKRSSVSRFAQSKRQQIYHMIPVRSTGRRTSALHFILTYFNHLGIGVYRCKKLPSN